METSQVKGYFTNEDKFIPKGEYKKSNEIERCSFETTWKLL